MVVQKRIQIINNIVKLIEHIYTKYNVSYDMTNIPFNERYYVRIPKRIVTDSQYEPYKTHINILNKTIDSIINNEVVNRELLKLAESVSCYYDLESIDNGIYLYQDLYGLGGSTSTTGFSVDEIPVLSSMDKFGFNIVTSPIMPKNLVIAYGS